MLGPVPHKYITYYKQLLLRNRDAGKLQVIQVVEAVHRLFLWICFDSIQTSMGAENSVLSNQLAQVQKKLRN